VAALVLAQFALGIANIVLLTPIWLQLAHLLAADLLWIACVLLVVAQSWKQAQNRPSSNSPMRNTGERRFTAGLRLPCPTALEP
jgi:heme A synthase